MSGFQARWYGFEHNNASLDFDIVNVEKVLKIFIMFLCNTHV